MLSLKLQESPALAEPAPDRATDPVLESAAQVCDIWSLQAGPLGPIQEEDIRAAKTANIGFTQTEDSGSIGAFGIPPMQAARIADTQTENTRPAPIKEASRTQDESSSPTQADDIKPAKPASLWRPSRRRLIMLAAIVLGIRIFIGEASVVPTASMEGTILVGDHLFMDKLLYGPEIPLVHWRLPMLKKIRRGDIVVFRYPKNPSETYLKRVAAAGGDRLEIRNGVLYVNSLPVLEPYAVHHAPVHSPQESWGPTVVPPGNLFVMGDNRDNSSDSRDWGFVPVKNVIGEPLFVYWSYDAPTARWLDENPAHRVSFYASILGNFFSRTRWKRTGMLL